MSSSSSSSSSTPPLKAKRIDGERKKGEIMSLRERSETNRDVREVSIHPVCIPYLLDTLALLDLFVLDTSYICLDRSGLRILIVDHMMMMMMMTIISLSFTPIPQILLYLIEFLFSPSSSAPCHSFKILPPSLPSSLPSSRPSNQIKEAKSKKKLKKISTQS